MFDYLVREAQKTIWCTPDQDLPMIFRPARITPINGVEDSFRLMWDRYPLPSKDERYHVYQIGQRYPITLGLPDTKNQWLKLSTLCEQEYLIADLYTTDGLQFPRTQAWVKIGPDKTLLIAVKRDDKIANLNHQPLFLRLYSNAYFNSLRREDYDAIIVKGQRLETTDQRIIFQRSYEDHLQLPGHAYAFVNGRYVHNVTPNTANVGDYVEFVYDSSIYRTIEIPVKDLRDFESELDACRKYLVHYSDMLNDSIEYFDDIDFWLINRKENQTPFKGVYYHKNQVKSVRMVTHKDYSLPTAAVHEYRDNHPGLWDSVNDMVLRFHVRRSGYERPLSFEHNRIKELYKLNDQDVLNAMLGVDSTVSVWRAEALEMSGYAQIMQDWDGQLEQTTVQRAYGYNAAAKITADTPDYFREEGGLWLVDVPPGLQRRSAVYEYDSNGQLLGSYSISGQEQHLAVNSNAYLAEIIAGEGGWNQGTVFGEQNQQLDLNANHRFYICPIINDIATEEWEDVTGTDKYFLTDNGIVQWAVDFSYYLTAVRSDDYHLNYDLELDSSDGLVRFSVQAEEPWFGIVNRRVANLPPGRLDVWLNGHSLIENLDYFVRWPQVVITNKSYLNNNGTEYVTVRATGFCREDMSREPIEDHGFVEYGLLSHNSRFDLRDDKITRLVVGGGLRHKETLEFAEEHDGVYVGQAQNGTPYSLRDVIVPMRGLIGDPFEYRQRSLDVDQEVADYLSLKLPEAPRDTPSSIQQKYRVYSPLVSKVIHDLLSGIINDPRLESYYGADVIWELIEPYEYLIDYDPTKVGVNGEYVAVHPHNYDHVVELNIFQYRFVQRMIKVVLDDKIDLTSHVRMVELNHE